MRVTVKLDELPDGATVFVDASIFTYYLTGDDALAQACAAFFGGIEEYLKCNRPIRK